MRDYYVALLPISLKGCRLNPYGLIFIGGSIISGHIMLTAIQWLHAVWLWHF